MKYATSAASALTQYLQRGDTLPLTQLRRLGLIYSSYRLVISLFFILMSYASIGSDDSSLLPSLLQQTALVFYVILSLILLGLFYVVTKEPRQQLIFGLALDIVILSLLLYTNGAPDLQLTMLYMVVVAASFMLLSGSQALIITLLAIIFVIYQQFFYAIANSMSLSNLGDALLMSASFLTVGFLSWSISQRLVQVEKLAAKHSNEVERLNTINQEVIKQMVNGVIVIDQKRVVLANRAAHQLLNIASRFEEQFSQRHPQLFAGCLSVAPGQSRLFIYELPKSDSASIVGKLRVQLTPLKGSSQLIILEDLRREQASAQQLKLASLGQLTASIAHEIRNPLATISQASEL
ncbi:PAS domain-containing protein, partial [Psychrobacter sp. T6-1]